MSAKLFVSYSHRDEQLRAELAKHLKGLEREGVLTPWHDAQIAPGQDWRGTIEARLAEADVILLLVSADFLASDFCYSVEVAEAMRRSVRGETIVIPIILRSVDWSGAPFAHLQVLPADGRAVTSSTSVDDALRSIAVAIRQRVLRAARRTERGLDVVEIPAGAFLMGTAEDDFRRLAITDPVAAARESPQHLVHLPAFCIGRTPVTNRQYREFLEANPDRAVPYRDDPWSTRFNWSAETRTYPEATDDHPVVLVSWVDATAFCRWIGGRLPTEAEWEKAARGEDGRCWPWGDLWQASRCNTVESNRDGPSPAGAFSPRGDSPYGVADMSGNVWEWCSSALDPYPWSAVDGRDADAAGERVIRGGAWNLDRTKARCAYRGGTGAGDFGFTIGFRVVFEVAYAAG